MQIAPRILKGFRDALPQQEIVRRDAMSSLERTFSAHGLVPIDTPALEYTDVLLGKGGGETDKQVYSFEDHGKREVSLRFDLTVPFARYMAMHVNEVGLPFKRYHMAKVWRGENTQKGRYREFYQCDFDIVGIDTAAADFEILLLIYDALDGLGLKDFTLHISHRGIFNDYLKILGITEHSLEILRSVDKLGKIGREKTFEQLCQIVRSKEAEQILTFILSGGSDMRSSLERIAALLGERTEHLERLQQIADYLAESQLPAKVLFNPAITRGLDYYTGIVYETFLDQMPDIGSVCSGGRYNNLASLYTKENLPGVGASIGIDRLLAALEDPRMGGTEESQIPWADVLILCLDETLTGFNTRTAAYLRKEGFRVEQYHEKKKISQQFKYAQRRSIPFAVIAGEEERAAGTVNIKHLSSRQELQGADLAEAAEFIRERSQ